VDRDSETGAAGSWQIRRLARQSAFLLSSGGVSYVGALLLNVLLARRLGPTGFGAWVIAFSLTSTLSTIGLVGADWVLVRHGSYFEGVNDHARLRRLVHLALSVAGSSLVILGAILFGLAPVIGRAIFHDASVVPLLRLAGVVVPVVGIGQVMINGTRAFKSVRELVLVNNILQPILRLAGVGIAVLLFATETSAFTGLLVAEICLTVAAIASFQRRLSLIGPTQSVPVREIVGFGLPTWGQRILETIQAQLFTMVLGSWASFSASGVYVASKRVAAAPRSVIATMNKVYGPIASDLYMQNRRADLVVLFKNLGKWSFALAWPLFCLLAAFPREVLSLFGNAFTNASPVLVILAVAMLFSFGTGPVTSTLVISGRPKLALLDFAAVLAIELGLGLWLIPNMGVVGAAFAKLAGSAVNNVLPLVQVWRLEGFHPYRMDYWKPVVAGAGAVVFAKMALAAASIGSGVTAAVAAGTVIGASYCGLLLLFGLSEEDRAAIDTLVRRARSRRPPAPAVETPVGD
jgi:O-antigen/teichoic acid export membrane protein